MSGKKRRPGVGAPAFEEVKMGQKMQFTPKEREQCPHPRGSVNND